MRGASTHARGLSQPRPPAVEVMAGMANDLDALFEAIRARFECWGHRATTTRSDSSVSCESFSTRSEKKRPRACAVSTRAADWLDQVAVGLRPQVRKYRVGIMSVFGFARCSRT